MGRGLDALLEVEDSARDDDGVGRQDYDQTGSSRELHFDSPALAELAASIQTQGVVQPIVVTPSEKKGEYTIIAGERRWRAAKQAGLEGSADRRSRGDSDREMFEMALVENLQRADLNPVEEAEAYKRLVEEFELKQEDVAARVGKSRSTVSNAIRLLGLPVEVQDLLRDGALSAGHVRPLLALPGADEQIRWARRATQEKFTARQMEKAVAGRGTKKKRGRTPPDADTAAAEETLTKIFHSKVEIHRRRKGGTLNIAFHSEDELIRLYDLLVQVGEER